ncbi:MAG: hypothetical protein ACI35Q_11160 [Marinilabiliaceae bacterium]
MKKIISFATSILALAATTSCEHDDYDTYFSDISIEDCVSVWYVGGSQFWGTAMNGDWVCDEDCESPDIISFRRDGTGIAYYYDYEKYQESKSIDSVCFTYKTDDACHFEISTAEGDRVITFAKESLWDAGKRTSNCVIYWKEKEYGREIYRWHRCREMRTDTALLQRRDYLKGRLSVPKARVWKGKNIVGEYENDGTWCPNDEFRLKYETLDFYSDNRFLANKGNYEQSIYQAKRWGEYAVKEGERDSIFLKLDGEQEQEGFHIIFDWDGAFLYKDGVLAMELLDLNRECGY